MNKRTVARIAASWGLFFGLALPARAADTVQLLVALHWEGRDLHEHNLQAIRAFREQFRDVRLVHFVSPAYFLKGDASAAARIKSVMRPGDRVGLALGGWKSIATAAQVTFRDGPTFWGHKLRAIDCKDDCGIDVPLTVYADGDAAQLVATGLSILEINGFGRVQSLAITGWVASPDLLRAAAKSGVRYDFSAVAPASIERRAGRFPLFQWVRDQWATVTIQAQPFTVDGVAGVLEVPQTLAAIDYLAADDTLSNFRATIELIKREPGKDRIFSLAAYQETAFKELPRLAAALQALFAEAVSQGISVQPAAIPQDLAPLPEEAPLTAH